jgi:hypothetical protein
MINKALVFCAAVLAAILAVPIGLSANTAGAAPIKAEVTKQMNEAKQASYELRDAADRLQMITRGRNHSWHSHSSYLSDARENVNRLGKMLASLEDLKPHGTESQQIAIEAMRPRLVHTADALTNAIELLNDRRHNVYFSEYSEAVQTVTEQANSLHETLDAVLKYEAAKDRFEGLELGPTTESQS